MPKAAVTICNQPRCPHPATNRGRCPTHYRALQRSKGTRQQQGYGPEYQTNRAILLAGATCCHICGGSPTPDNPLTADHITPRKQGGGPELANLRPAHARCNSGRRD